MLMHEYTEHDTVLAGPGECYQYNVSFCGAVIVLEAESQETLRMLASDIHLWSRSF